MRFNRVEEIKKQYENMFPNAEFLEHVLKLNQMQAQTFFKMFFRFFVAQIIVLVIFLSSPELPVEIVAITNGSLFLLFTIVLIAVLSKINIKKKRVFKVQFDELVKNNDEDRLKLHKLFKDYEKSGISSI